MLLGAGDLPAEDGFGEAGLALVLGFADADHGDQVVGERGFELPVDHVVGLVGVDAAFGVAQQDVGAADAGEHGGGGLSGVGTLVEPMHGLGAGGDVGAFDGLDDVAERGHGGEEGNVLIAVALDQGKELI
jgi:hypothetical protein